MSPPGRPRSFDADRVLDDAMRVFWRAGYRRTGTRDLERALGVTQSSLYNAFGSKAALFEEALGRYLDRLDAALLAPLASSPDGLAALDRFLAGLGDWLRADGVRGCMIGRVMSEGPVTEPAAAARIGEYRTRLRAALAAAMGRAVAGGEIPAADVDDRIRVVIGMVLGLNMAVQAGYDAEEIDAMVRADRAEVARWGSRAPS